MVGVAVGPLLLVVTLLLDQALVLRSSLEVVAETLGMVPEDNEMGLEMGSSELLTSTELELTNSTELELLTSMELELLISMEELVTGLELAAELGSGARLELSISELVSTKTLDEEAKLDVSIEPDADRELERSTMEVLSS